MAVPVTILVLLIAFVWWLATIFGMIDAALEPNSTWQAADQSKVAWILVIAATGLIGALVYFTVVKSRLDDAVSAARTPRWLPASTDGTSTRVCTNPRCEADGLPTPLERCDICGHATVATAPAVS